MRKTYSNEVYFILFYLYIYSFQLKYLIWNICLYYHFKEPNHRKYSHQSPLKWWKHNWQLIHENKLFYYCQKHPKYTQKFVSCGVVTCSCNWANSLRHNSRIWLDCDGFWTESIIKFWARNERNWFFSVNWAYNTTQIQILKSNTKNVEYKSKF